MLEAHSDEREFVRIDTQLPLRYQRLTATEYRRESARILLDRQARMNPFLPLMERWSSQDEQSTRSVELERLLGPVLAAMNEKLDRILAILDPSDPTALRFAMPQALNISAAGVGLTLTECFSLDTVLALDFFLPFSFPLLIKAIGKVTRVDPLNLEPQQWYTATKFDVIHEEDREAIIRYIFREQRLALRTRHSPITFRNMEPLHPSSDDLR
jgi:hypothetical protein